MLHYILRNIQLLVTQILYKYNDPITININNKIINIIIRGTFISSLMNLVTTSTLTFFQTIVFLNFTNTLLDLFFLYFFKYSFIYSFFFVFLLKTYFLYCFPYSFILLSYSIFVRCISVLISRILSFVIFPLR